MNVDSTTLINLLSLVAALTLLIVWLDRSWGHAPARPGDALPPAPLALPDLLIAAVWFGLITGVLHVTLAVINRYVRDRFLMVGPQIVWLAPLSYVLIFVGVAIAFVVLRLARPRLLSFAAVAGSFAWLGIFALLLPFHQLHQIAAAVLAAGVAVQMARIMARQPVRWARVMRKSALALIVVIAAVAIALSGWRAAGEAREMRRLPASRAGDPNVLLIVMDTVRAENLSLYGYGRPTTPELSRIAADGATFDFAFSTAPWTLLSHASMFTGLYPRQIEGNFERPIRSPRPMLAEMFRERGYVTGGFVANLPYTSRESGLTRGFVHYDDYRVTPRQALLHSWIAHTPLFRGLVGSRSVSDLVETIKRPSLTFEPDDFNDRTYARKTAGEINDAFLDWQRAHADRPFFAFLNYFDAHIPYRPSPSFAAKFALTERRNVGLYDGAIAYIDHEIGRTLDSLRQRGVLDNTIVIITSDHGEQFGEHALRLHGNSLYLPLLHVPLIIRHPAQVAKGVRVESPVTLRDLAATIAELSGVTAQPPVPGNSLSGYWKDPATRTGSPIVAELTDVVRPSSDWPIFYGPMVSALDERFHYIKRGDGLEQLFDYRADRAEARDLAKSPEGEAALVRLRALVAQLANR